MQFPEFHTERIHLKHLSQQHRDGIFALRSDPQVGKYLKRPLLKRIGEAADFIADIQHRITQDKCHYWAIIIRKTKEFAGTICLWNFNDDLSEAEVGYELIQKFHGQGIMDESLKMVTRYALTGGGFKRIVAYTHHRNVPSINLLLRNEFVLNPNRRDPENENNAIYMRQSSPA